MNQINSMEKEKYFIKIMILNAYIYAGWWAYSLDHDELERYMEKLNQLFVDNGLSGELFLKDNNGEYSNYRNYLLSLFNGDDDSLGCYDEEYNEVAVELDYKCFRKVLEKAIDYDKTFIEWGSYYMTDCSMEEVFEENRGKNFLGSACESSQKLVKKKEFCNEVSD